MIDTRLFYNCLQEAGIDFFTGVPDSLLKSFSAWLFDTCDQYTHVIAANEGSAVALAAGSFLATGNTSLVYLQNSGLGNTINPVLSLADPEVYSIPMVLLIGWRGEPGVKDEPQHVKQGRVQQRLLDAMEVPTYVLSAATEDWESIVSGAVKEACARSGPVALVVRKGTFTPYVLQRENTLDADDRMTREDALEHIIASLHPDDLVVSTTGMTSREVFEIRARTGAGHHRDFLTVGSMGHASQIALGIALRAPHRKVFCLDGDGATIMHMGSLAIIGQHAPANLHHVILNNGAHDSVGGQPTAAATTSLADVALACRYKHTGIVATENELKDAMSTLREINGPTMTDVRVKPGARADLGRPTRTPIENRNDFEINLRSTD